MCLSQTAADCLVFIVGAYVLYCGLQSGRTSGRRFVSTREREKAAIAKYQQDLDDILCDAGDDASLMSTDMPQHDAYAGGVFLTLIAFPD